MHFAHEVESSVDEVLLESLHELGELGALHLAALLEPLEVERRRRDRIAHHDRIRRIILMLLPRLLLLL